MSHFDQHAAQKILEGVAMFGALVVIGAVYVYWLAIHGDDI